MMRSWFFLGRERHGRRGGWARSVCRRGFLLAALVTIGAVSPLAAQVTLRLSSTEKLYQLVGDSDWAPGSGIMGNLTPNPTFGNYNVLANGHGYSFEHLTTSGSELIFLFGDTVSFGTWSPAPQGFDCDAVPVGAATSDLPNSCGLPLDQTWVAPLTCYSQAGIPLSPAIDCKDNPTGSGFPSYHAQDPLAYSTTTDPERPPGLRLQFFQSGTATPANLNLPLFVSPMNSDGTQTIMDPCISQSVKITTGGDDIPNAGIDVDGQMYLVYSSGSEIATSGDPHQFNFSVLLHFDPNAQTFETQPFNGSPSGLISCLNAGAGGHFIFTSLHEVPAGTVSAFPNEPAILMFGIGYYRNSDVYLAAIPKSGFSTGSGIVYLTNVDAYGNATWCGSGSSPACNDSSALQPLFSDCCNHTMNPPSGPSVGKFSVSYSLLLGLWLMTYTADGPNPPITVGTYVRYARNPWGPWSSPQPLFLPCHDGMTSAAWTQAWPPPGGAEQGFGNFIHYQAPDAKSDFCVSAHLPGTVTDYPYSAGPAGPTFGEELVLPPPQASSGQDPQQTLGLADAPFMVERFQTLGLSSLFPPQLTLSIYYTLSTWNPYTVVLMKSTFDVDLNFP
jgi:hypothetical protein